MRKYIVLLTAAMFLVACGNNKEFNETNFIEIYESLNDRNLPNNIIHSNDAGTINLSNATREEVLDLLYTVRNFTTSKELKRMIMSIENNESNIKTEVETDTHYINYYNFDEEHNLIVRSKETDINTEDNEQLIGFIEKYNEEIEQLNDSENDLPFLEKINIDDVEDIRIDSGRKWQSLSTIEEDESNYTVELKYDEQMNINGYHISIKSKSPDGHYLSAGIASATLIAYLIDLDLIKYDEKFDSFLYSDDDTLDYQDNDYKVSFVKMDIEDYGTLIIDFQEGD